MLGQKGKYVSLGTCSLVVEHGERTLPGRPIRECFMEETVLGQVCWAYPIETHPNPVSSQRPLSSPSLARTIGWLPSATKDPSLPYTLNPYDPPGLHPQYSWQGDGFATNNSQSPWQAAPTGHLCFWPLSQHQWAGQGHEHCPDG